MVRALIIAAVLVLSGCMTPEVIYRDVEIPVSVPPKQPPEYDVPDIPIHHLTDEDRKNPKVVAEAYVRSVKILMNHVMTGKGIIDTYRSKNEQ